MQLSPIQHGSPTWLPTTMPLSAAPRAHPVTGEAPGPELPAIPPRHPALPSPAPSLVQLATIAERAPANQRFTPGAHPSTIRNAHYTNTRSQLAFALAGVYNSVEGDVRLRDGRAVMQHDAGAAADLTFEQWALLSARAGKHLRIDMKEANALPAVTATLKRLRIDPGTVTFNVGVRAPWSTASMSIEAIRALRNLFPASWITLNLPLPLGPGYLLAVDAARRIGPARLGVAVMAGLVHRADVAFLRSTFDAVNAWNIPGVGSVDPAMSARRLRAIGVNGMIDLRRANDPLAVD